MASGAPGSGGQYFDKKGEVNELRQLLRSVSMDKDIKKKRDAIKKVIAYMTLGIDVSRLFTDMVMACHTTDLVQKKMIYLYLVNYAEQNAELAILAVNTLQKDSTDDDPTIRGLALRSLCSLRLESVFEYCETAVRRGLTDVNGYVRKTAVMGCIKLFHVNPRMVREGDILDTVHRLLGDNDVNVVSNAIHAIDIVKADAGGLQFTSAVCAHLLNRISAFSEWGQCAVLEKLADYQPSTEAEMFDIMNVLEELLKHSSAAVLLACSKVFMNLTSTNSALNKQVLMRLKPPLLTLASTSPPELGYTVLAHIHLILSRGNASIMQADFKQFFCRYNDPTYIKVVKLEILTCLATEETVQPIVEEMSEYVADVDAEISRKSIRAICSIAMRLPYAADHIISALLQFLDLKIDYVCTETLVAMKDLLRKYREHYGKVVEMIPQCMSLVTEPEGRCAVLWIVGEYGEQFDDAPYLLEPVIQDFDTQPPDVKLELLTATVKLFFARPPEVQAMLGQLLHKGISTCNHHDVRDRALSYHRLLEYSVDEARRVICSPKDLIHAFQDEQDSEVRDRIFAEFNTLSVVYNQPSHKFIIAKQSLYSAENDEGGEEEEEEAGEEEEEEEEAGEEEGAYDSGANGDAYGHVASAPAAQPGLLDDEVDLIGGGPPAGPTFSLLPTCSLDPNTFQAKWKQMTLSQSLQHSVRAPSNPKVVDQQLRPVGMISMASGAVGGSLKFYFYAQQANVATPTWFLLELIILIEGNVANITVKTDNGSPEGMQQFVELLKSRLVF